MPSYAYNGRHQKLLGMLQDEAPNASAQQKCADIYNQMVEDNCSETLIELNLLRMLVDGKAYGNWPWTFDRPNYCWKCGHQKNSPKHWQFCTEADNR